MNINRVIFFRVLCRTGFSTYQVAFLFFLFFNNPVVSLASHNHYQDAPVKDPAILDIINEFEKTIPQQIINEKIPGFAIVIVAPDTILWWRCYGFTDDNKIKPVNEKTIFSVQSISKTFTATAVMHAVQEGLLDLNVPVKKYIPDFVVNSRFDDDPFSKITLKHLLCHKAGFTHEAPIGNNFDANFSSFEEHVMSISDTWLKFPVGERFSYSNLGIDLAGWILEKESGMYLHEYVRKNILEPIGMHNSSFDTDWILNHDNRASGHADIFPSIPVAIPIIPSGGFYASITDMARFVQFHLNKGRVCDSIVIRSEMLDTMYTIPFAYPGQRFGYGLGIDRWGINKTLVLNHGGGGFGFLSFMMWYPDYDFGIVTLSNADDHNLQYDFAMDLSEKILTYLKKRRGITDEPDLTGFPPQAPGRSMPSGVGPDKPEWKKYTGVYRVKSFNQPIWKFVLKIKNGYLHYNGQQLEEFLPGLFFDRDGEAIDMRGPIPTFRNIKLEKIKIPLLVHIFTFLVALISISFIISWPLIYILKRTNSQIRIEIDKKWPALYIIMGFLIAFLLVSYIYLLIYEIPFALYETYPWYYRYPIYVKIALLMPFITTLFGIFLLVSALRIWRQNYGIKIQRIIYTALTSGSLLFIILLVHWKQFGTFF